MMGRRRGLIKNLPIFSFSPAAAVAARIRSQVSWGKLGKQQMWSTHVWDCLMLGIDFSRFSSSVLHQLAGRTIMLWSTRLGWWSWLQLSPRLQIKQAINQSNFDAWFGLLVDRLEDFPMFRISWSCRFLQYITLGLLICFCLYSNSISTFARSEMLSNFYGIPSKKRKKTIVWFESKFSTFHKIH